MVRRALGTIDFEIRVLSHEAALKRQLELEVLLLTQALAIADDTFGLFAPPPLRAPNAGDGNHGLALLPPAARPTVGRSHSLEICRTVGSWLLRWLGHARPLLTASSPLSSANSGSAGCSSRHYTTEQNIKNTLAGARAFAHSAVAVRSSHRALFSLSLGRPAAADHPAGTGCPQRNETFTRGQEGPRRARSSQSFSSRRRAAKAVPSP